MEKNQAKKRGQQDGFSLIEVAIVLVVIGLLITPLIHIHQKEMRERALAKDQGNVLAIQNALQRFVIRNGRYPLPAEPAVAFGAAGFGQETAVAAGAIPNCNPGRIEVCRTNGARDILTPATIPPGDAGPDPVLIGSLPAAALGLPKEFITDSRGYKFTYAVSESLTATATFADWAGVIEILDRAGGQHNGTIQNVHYVVVSTGENRRGAFNLAGNRIVSCVGANTADRENCNNDATFNSNFDTMPVGPGTTDYRRVAVIGPGAGNQYYDDYLVFATTASTDIWTPQANQPNMFSRNAGNVRIGAMAVATNPAAKIDVQGTAASPGHVQADSLATPQICSPLGLCRRPPFDDPLALGDLALVAPAWRGMVFTPAIIGGSPSPANAGKLGGGILCDADNGMINITFSNEVCGNAAPSPAYITAPLNCTDPGMGGRRITGGVLTCAP